MHASLGNRDQSAGNAARRHRDIVGVGAGSAAAHVILPFDVVLVGHRHQLFGDGAAEHGRKSDHRAFAQLAAVLVGAAGIGAEAHIHHNGLCRRGGKSGTARR